MRSRATLSNSTDFHRIVSPSGFGIVVYGYGKDTSYMYPGGLESGSTSPTPGAMTARPERTIMSRHPHLLLLLTSAALVGLVACGSNDHGAQPGEAGG